MSPFSAGWLGLREAVDASSRSAALGATLVAALRRNQPPDGALAIVDLGAGTGSNLRYLAPLIGGAQTWLLVEKDPLLLAAANPRIEVWAQLSGAQVTERDGEMMVEGALFQCRVRGLGLDLVQDLERLVLPRGGLVSASALLDLVSMEWLAVLADRCRSAAATVCFALTYDGRIACQPMDPDDAEVRDLVNIHQRSDKGFGPALGPDAAANAMRIFAGRGYRTECAASDWRLGHDRQELQRALLEGWFEAAREVSPQREAQFKQWLERRLAIVGTGQAELLVGHSDMIAWPPAATSFAEQ